MTERTFLSVEYDGRPTKVSARLRLAGDDLMVFLHGLGCSKEGFSEAFDIPGLADLSVCSFDFPGHGESDRWREDAYSLDAFAAITERVVAQVRGRLSTGDGRVILVGHSMGGAVALLATQGIPALSHYLCVEGNLVGDDCGLISRKIAAESIGRFVSTGYQAFLDELRASGQRDLQAWAGWYSAADPAAIHQGAGSLVEWSDSGKLLQLFLDLALPKAYIFGAREDKDHLLPWLDAYRVPIHDAGHFVMIDQPREFYDVLVDACRRPHLTSTDLPAGRSVPTTPQG